MNINLRIKFPKQDFREQPTSSCRRGWRHFMHPTLLRRYQFPCLQRWNPRPHCHRSKGNDALKKVPSTIVVREQKIIRSSMQQALHIQREFARWQIFCSLANCKPDCGWGYTSDSPRKRRQQLRESKEVTGFMQIEDFIYRPFDEYPSWFRRRP